MFAPVGRIEFLNYDLQPDELDWKEGVLADFNTEKAKFAGRMNEFNPRETLREIVGRKKHALPVAIDATGDGAFRGGINSHDRLCSIVFPHIGETGKFLDDLHEHGDSVTDQFGVCAINEDGSLREDGGRAFTVGEDGRAVVKQVLGGEHFRNLPRQPHAFTDGVVFIAITPRPIIEDTQDVSEAVRRQFKKMVGHDAPEPRS